MEKMRGGFRRLRAVTLAALIVVGLSTPSQAGPLGVPTDPYPAILAGFITTSFNVTTGVLTAQGLTNTIIDQNNVTSSVSTNFLLTATLETVNGVTKALSATLLIGSADSPELLSTTLAPGVPNFAYTPVVGGQIEFLFQPISGRLVDSGMFPQTKPLDVLLYGLGTRFPGKFTNSFTTSGNSATIKVDPPPAAVPEPGTLTLMLFAFGGLVAHGRRRRGTPPATI